jgi:hypothetical protein
MNDKCWQKIILQLKIKLKCNILHFFLSFQKEEDLEEERHLRSYTGVD